MLYYARFMQNSSTKELESLLEQVKMEFRDQPDVYNKFLDIMKAYHEKT